MATFLSYIYIQNSDNSEGNKRSPDGDRKVVVKNSNKLDRTTLGSAVRVSMLILAAVTVISVAIMTR
jgi:hypothetical protein